MNRRYALQVSSILGLLAFSCASPPKHKAYPVLEPMDPPSTQKEVAVNPRYQNLLTLLNSLGAEPVGMEFETDANLDLLNEIFSSPVAQHRKIKLVYTGLQMAYEKETESLTIGGMTNVVQILAYIQKNVPVNKNPVQPIRPSQPIRSKGPKPSPSVSPPAATSPAPVTSPSALPRSSPISEPRFPVESERKVDPGTEQKESSPEDSKKAPTLIQEDEIPVEDSSSPTDN